MKELDYSYCLWLNNKKIYNASEIKNNFDLKSLRGYFLGGSLINWLIRNSGDDIAEYLNNVLIPESGNVDGILEYAFGIRGNLPVIADETINVLVNNEFSNKKYEFSSFPHSFSLRLTSGISSVYSIFGSYKAGSFLYLSSGFGGSFTGSWIFIKSSGFQYTSSGTLKNINSFSSNTDTDFYIPSEVKSNIEKCPLNKYGYGIHLI